MIGARTAMVRGLLAPYLETGTFGSLEVHAVERIASACSTTIGHFDALTIAAAVWATQQGHVCFDLGDASLLDDLAVARRPDVDSWFAYLEGSLLVHRAATWGDLPDPARPLVMYGSRIYLARQWIDEGVVAHSLARRRGVLTQPMDTSIVNSLFAPVDRGEPQYQAVVRSLEARTSIVTGGPGTGKTYTIARILVAAVRSGVDSIALAAPTAKAAVQMRESLSAALANDIPGLDDHGRRLLERLEPMTIHRLLGRRSGSSTRFRHGAGLPLPLGLLVVDEMSMVSLPLMARLLEAVDDATALVLVGDPGQLDSVENGSILRDLTGLDLGPSMPTTVLESSRRNMGTRSSSFADAVRVGDSARALALLQATDVDETLRIIETAEPLSAIDSLGAIIDLWRSISTLASRGDVTGALAGVNDARVLCPHREGPYGVETWNAKLSEAVAESRDRWRPGDIVVKTRNDLGQGLANGDTGVVVRIDGDLVFAFRHADSVVTVPVSVDDAVQLAFATTVHKAQGSEYAHVVVVAPPRGSALATRELLYTAMTRAKPHAVIIGTTEDLAHAIDTRQTRSSGLADRLSAS